MSRADKRSGDDLVAEFHGDSLGDARLDDRLQRIVALVSRDPALSFPEQMVSVADREALYRFLGNRRVTMAGVLGGHLRQTLERIRGRDVVRVVHDTTAFRFAGDREGLGVLRGGVNGFFGHMALAVAADETREPLGVLGVQPFIHRHTAEQRGRTNNERIVAIRRRPRADRESVRWEQLAEAVSRQLPDTVLALHVMDQEADDYDLLAALQTAALHFVVRACPQRQTSDAKRPVAEVLAHRPARLLRRVPLTPRSAQHARRHHGRHPIRTERIATLHVRWGTVSLPRGRYSTTPTRSVTLQAVHVVEPDPPPGETPVEWMLFTSEPVETGADARRIVDHYRARWLIEEYFKALKTGCAFEKRQLTTLPALVRALAIFVPMAWRLLALRHLSRARRAQPVYDVLTGTQLLLLRKLLVARRYALPAHPTMQEAMLGVAALGGHIKNNGAPGWLVLGRGLIRLLDTEVGWRLARAEM